MVTQSQWQRSSLLILLAGLTGCGTSETDRGDAKQVTKSVDDHSGWWCVEHGIPEEVCAQCDIQVAVDLKAKGDWCHQHDRPESQCFACHPESERQFSAQYEAKFGVAPPTRTEG